MSTRSGWRLVEDPAAPFNGTLIWLRPGERWRLRARTLADGTIVPQDGSHRIAAESADMPTEAVRFLTVDARPTAVIARTTTRTEFPTLWGPLLAQVYEFVRPRPELATGEGDGLWQNILLYKDGRPDVEVGVLVSAPFQSAGPVTASALPTGEVATATHRGDYAKLGVTHDAVREYVAAHGRELAGPRWEIYGHTGPDPSEAETEVVWLLR